MDIIVVVLGADTKKQRTRDSINIINYIYKNFEYANISEYAQKSFEEYKKHYISSVNLYKTTTVPKIELSELNNYDFPFKRNSINSLSTKFYTLNKLSSNINFNEKIGQMTIYYENKPVCSMDILLKNELVQNSWIYYFVKILREFNFSFQK